MKIPFLNRPKVEKVEQQVKEVHKIELKEPFSDNAALMVLKDEWKELIRLCFNKKEFNAAITNAEFYKLVLNKLKLPFVPRWLDEDIEFTIEFEDDKIPQLKKILNASPLAPVIFENELVELTWDNADHIVKYTYDSKPFIELKTIIDLKHSKTIVTLNWANIKILLPYLKDNLRILIFISKLGKLND